MVWLSTKVESSRTSQATGTRPTRFLTLPREDPNSSSNVVTETASQFSKRAATYATISASTLEKGLSRAPTAGRLLPRVAT